MQLKQALLEAKDMVQLARTQEARVDKLDGELNRIKYEHQQMRTAMVDLKNTLRKVSKEVGYIYHCLTFMQGCTADKNIHRYQ